MVLLNTGDANVSQLLEVGIVATRVVVDSIDSDDVVGIDSITSALGSEQSVVVMGLEAKLSVDKIACGVSSQDVDVGVGVELLVTEHPHLVLGVIEVVDVVSHEGLKLSWSPMADSAVPDAEVVVSKDSVLSTGELSVVRTERDASELSPVSIVEHVKQGVGSIVPWSDRT